MSEYRVILMQCGDEESYALLFHEKDGAVIVDIYDTATRGLVHTLKTPFPVGGISSIRSIQSFDVMFFAQPDTPPCKLSRKDKEGADGEYEFSFEDNEFLPEPILDWEMKSEHSINVFALPDEELLVEDENGNKYFPRGVCREVVRSETLRFSYSYFDKWRGINGSGWWRDPDNYYYGPWYIRYEIYAFAESEKSSQYKKGTTFTFDSPLSVSMSYWASSLGVGVSNAAIIKCGGYDDEPMDFSNLSVSFTSGRVEKTGNGGVFVYIGYVCTRLEGRDGVDANEGIQGIQNHVSFSGASEASAKIRFGENQFYTTILDNVPEDASVEDVIYYKPLSGEGFDIAMTIDGGNENDSVSIGQVVVLSTQNSLQESQIWDYDSVPVGTTPDASPPVNTRDTLDSKKDYAGGELRPASGGGYGCASGWFAVRGKVGLKTEGKWSGVVELQELGKNGEMNTIATITSENGLSNTSLERDIDDFGSCVRVACVRREYAYEVTRSVNGDGIVYERIFKSDNGCQWILTSTDSQSAYVRVKSRKTLSDGTKCYIVTVIGGVSRSFSTDSYALGAWSEKNGYPEHVAIFQERLVYSCNRAKPTTLWMSKTNVWTDFELGTLDSSAITATLATDKYDRIKWILTNKSSITIGTNYNEFSLGANDGAVTTSDNVVATMTSSIGSGGVQADTLGTATIMVKTGGKELYRIDYNTLSEESAGNQISLLASHLFEDDPVKDMFSIKAPSNMLFCLHESGKLSSLTYEPEYGVTGWARHHVLDGVEDGCVFRRCGKDVLCLVVRKGERRIIGELDLSADVWTDDGEAYESAVVTTPISASNSGSGYGKQVNIAGCDVYVGAGTKRFSARLNGGDWVRADRRFDANNEPIPFTEQRVELPTTGAWVDEAIVEIRSDAPYPLVIHGIGANVKG